jgi:DNA-binding NarL/FixJ family response regulator
MPYLIGLYARLDVVTVPKLLRAGVQQLVSVQSGLGGLHAALRTASTASRPAITVDLLTARELEVLALICSGWPTTRIATALAISPHTVINHTRRIFMKLNVRSRTQAAAEATARGLWHEPPQVGVASTQPVILVDPGADEWSAARARGGDVVVVLTDPSSGGVAEAVARGARAVLGAESVAEHLPLAMAMVRAGYLIAPAQPARALIATAHPNVAAPALTPRERDILNSVARGDSVRQTAQTLGIAIKTVQNEQRQLFGRLGVRNRTEALMLARGLGLVDHNGHL